MTATSRLSTGAALSLIFFASVSAYRWPQPQLDSLEKFIYEGARPDGNEMQSLVVDCKLRTSGDSTQRTTVAAQWLRMSYHDSATFNITDQTGGLDGSIHFELDRAENIGDGLTLTRRDYASFPSKYVSKADVIAVGASFAVVVCGGPIIPLRGGRVDATGPGSPGVPEPHQDLQTHIEKFRLQGFNATEMIEIIACGHTLGGVESKDFPLIVNPPTSDPNVSRSAPFDNTTAFDTAVVTKYLDGSTQNPLVVGHNETTRSDLRIFSSDNNVTMKSLSDSNVFRERCTVLFERMLHTVPAGVQLTEPIQILPEKPQQVGLRILNGTLTFMTILRLARPQSSTFDDPANLSLFWCDKYGENADCRSGLANRLRGATDGTNSNILSPITAALGLNFRYYTFHAPIDVTRSISSFWWQLDNGNGTTSVFDNDGAQYPLVQDQIIFPTGFVDHIVSENLANGSVSGTYSIAAGVREDLKSDRVYARVLDLTHFDRPVGSVVNFTVDFVENSTLPSAPGYKMYSAQFSLVGTGPTIDFHVDGNGTTYTLDLQPIMLPGSPTVPPKLGPVDVVPYPPPTNGSGGGNDSDTSSASAVLPAFWIFSLAFALMPSLACLLVVL
ncbi:hypothetical protein CVT24_011259 [Panaeolus cyanescens]|uniref:Peroxidase n=1 Tax=Panaeolus cyanescens TaxID=181874 RepID=A0A409VI97_9AGAR|nr:hypothetical protein CVT24_011259 [Panaeolus cyanescens]